MRRVITALVFFALLVGLWQWACMREIWSPVLVPPPTAVAQYLWSAVMDGSLAEATLVTLKRLGMGYVVGLVLGIPIGFLTARFRILRDSIGVLALGLQGLPSVCWVPLALLWFGQTESAMLFVVVMGTLWAVVLASDTGVRHVNPLYVRAARSMGSHGLHLWTAVIFPAALPFIVSGMKQGWAFAWRSLMAAEIFVTIVTGFGLGHLLHYGRELNAMEQVIGIMVVLVLVGLIADHVLFSPCEKWLHRRWGTDRAA